MAEIVLIDPFISLGGTDFSEHFKSISLAPTVDTQDSTAFGDEWTEMEPGLKRSFPSQWTSTKTLPLVASMP